MSPKVSDDVSKNKAIQDLVDTWGTSSAKLAWELQNLLFKEVGEATKQFLASYDSSDQESRFPDYKLFESILSCDFFVLNCFSASSRPWDPY